MYDKFYDIVLPQPLIWKDVVGYEGLYQVNNYGQVRSLDRTRTWWRSDIGSYTTRTFKGQDMSLKLKSTGYLEVHLRDEDTHNYWTVHKLVSEAFHGDITLPVVDHKDDNKTNNLLWNLQRCTVQFNTKKAHKAGKLQSGNSRYKSKLSNEIKESIKELLSEGKSMRSIENTIGVSQRSIARVRDGLI